jgi:serine phosphatase RsbU (regulator of sigma subunit)
VFDLPENRMGIVIADICDKGVGAALFMALFRSLIRIFSGQIVLEGLECPQTEENVPKAEDCASDPQTTPLRAVRYTNDYIAKNHGELAMFATLFFGVLDLQTGRLSYINGGHEPPLVHTAAADAIVKLLPTGPAVGVAEGVPFEIGDTRLNLGDALLGYTDGVIEAQSPDGNFFSQKRLLSVLAANNRSAADLINAIKTEVLTHTGQAAQFDDITMVALRRSPREPS